MGDKILTGIIVAAGAALIGGMLYLSYKSDEKDREREAEADKAAEEFARSISDPFARNRYLDTYYQNKRLQRQNRRLTEQNRALETMRQVRLTTEMLRQMNNDMERRSRRQRAADADFESIRTNIHAFG